MSDSDPDATAARIRREPPRFRRATVARVSAMSPHMVRVTLTGRELDGLRVDEPAASVRLLLPSPGSPALVLPTWAGNEFRWPDGSRALIRTLTPVRADGLAHELDLDIVLHGVGVASDWARAATLGDPAAISGPGRGYAIDLDATDYVIAGDESAIPAMRQLVEALPAAAAIGVFIEVALPDARIALPSLPGRTVTWLDRAAAALPGDALFHAMTRADIGPGTRVWVAGEAAAVQRIRRHLFTERGVERAHATVRGYWKHGRGGSPE